MRVIIACSAFLFAAAVRAGPGAAIFTHDCAAVDAAKTGFSCSLGQKETGGMVLHWTKKLSTMPPARRAQAKYAMNRIILGYYEAGGRNFEINATYWPVGRKRMCIVRSPSYVGCRTWQCGASGKDCRDIGQ